MPKKKKKKKRRYSTIISDELRQQLEGNVQPPFTVQDITNSLVIDQLKQVILLLEGKTKRIKNG